MTKINKDIFLNTLTCPTYGWQSSHNALQDEPSLYDQFLAEQGKDVHHRSHSLFPDGVLVDKKNFSKAVDQTQKLITDETTSEIFEASFSIDSYNTRADILKRNGKFWSLYEVKSSVNPHNEYLDDMAYTVMVLTRAGVKIVKFTLILIDPEYRLGMSDDKLFKQYDKTREVLARASAYENSWEEIKSIHQNDTPPDPELKLACKGCELFPDCVGEGIDNPIFDIPRLHKNKFAQLKDLEILRIEDIPDSFPLTKKQQVVKQSVDDGRVMVKKGLQKALSQIKLPAYYLDFETVTTAVPLYPHVAPFTQIVSQYSLHRCDSIGKVDRHYEYLAGPSRDCRRELAEQLIQDCGDVGSILTYSSFEKTVVNGLIRLFPDIQEELEGLVSRMIDLCSVISKYYYHPDFHGSYSIKKVLPVLVPEMSYEGLKVGNGSDAIAVYAMMAQGKYGGKELEDKREQLLQYCCQDTKAMVRLLEELVKIGK